MILCDAGPLVALVDVADEDHDACVAALADIDYLLTTWPCLTEAMYLLGRTTGFKQQKLLWQEVENGNIRLHETSRAEVERMRHFMQTYENVPMDLADASIVAAAESLNFDRIFTLDSDFRIYRTSGGRALEIIP